MNKLKDVLLAIVTVFGVAAFIFVFSTIESWPLMAVGFLGLLMWVLWIGIKVYEHRSIDKRPVIWMITANKRGVEHWTAMDGSGRTRPLNNPPPGTQNIYDQEADT